MKPSTLDEYLNQTEFVVRHLFDGLTQMRAIYSEAQSHWNLSRVNEEPSPKLDRDLQKYLELAQQYFGQKLSEGILSGGILQVAHTAIREFSRNTEVPTGCGSIPEIEKARCFCIGRRVHDLPLGIIIYAARNQWAHWEEEELRDPSRTVFARLAKEYRDDPLWDLALDLSNPSISVYANEVVLGLLGWSTYEQYDKDVRSMFAD